MKKQTIKIKINKVLFISLIMALVFVPTIRANDFDSEKENLSEINTSAISFSPSFEG